MKVVHFAQLDKDTILLCAESESALVVISRLCDSCHQMCFSFFCRVVFIAEACNVKIQYFVNACN